MDLGVILDFCTSGLLSLHLMELDEWVMVFPHFAKNRRINHLPSCKSSPQRGHDAEYDTPVGNMGQSNITLKLTKLKILIILSQPSLTCLTLPPKKHPLHLYKIYLHILFCHFFWPYSVVIDERRFGQFLAVTSGKWQFGGFFRWELAEADAEKCRSKKFDAVLAAAPNLGQLKPPNTSPVKQREVKTSLSRKTFRLHTCPWWFGKEERVKTTIFIKACENLIWKFTLDCNGNLVLPSYMLFVVCLKYTTDTWLKLWREDLGVEAWLPVHFWSHWSLRLLHLNT